MGKSFGCTRKISRSSRRGWLRQGQRFVRGPLISERLSCQHGVEQDNRRQATDMLPEKGCRAVSAQSCSRKHTGEATAVLRWGSSLEAALLINQQPWAGVLDFGKFQHSLPIWKMQAGSGSITHMLWICSPSLLSLGICPLPIPTIYSTHSPNIHRFSAYSNQSCWQSRAPSTTTCDRLLLSANNVFQGMILRVTYNLVIIISNTRLNCRGRTQWL
jgi:hypothetical protein